MTLPLPLEQTTGCLLVPKKWGITQAVGGLEHLHVEVLAIRSFGSVRNQRKAIHWQLDDQSSAKAFSGEEGCLDISTADLPFHPCRDHQKHGLRGSSRSGRGGLHCRMCGSWNPLKTRRAFAFQRTTPSSSSMRFQVNTHLAVITLLFLMAFSISPSVATCQTALLKY